MADKANSEIAELDLDAIRRRCEAATPGPWVNEGQVGDASELPAITKADAKANGDFVAHARTDIPALLAEIDRLRAKDEAAATALAELFTLFERQKNGTWCFLSLSRDGSRLDTVMDKLAALTTARSKKAEVE